MKFKKACIPILCSLKDEKGRHGLPYIEMRQGYTFTPDNEDNEPMEDAPVFGIYKDDGSWIVSCLQTGLMVSKGYKNATRPSTASAAMRRHLAQYMRMQDSKEFKKMRDTFQHAMDEYYDGKGYNLCSTCHFFGGYFGASYLCNEPDHSVCLDEMKDRCSYYVSRKRAL